MRLLLVDDHALFRHSLASQLLNYPDIETLTEAPDADTAIRLATEQHPDVVIMDIEMPGRDAFEAVGEIKSANPNCRVLFLSGYEYDSYIEKAIDVGANGYVFKQDNLEFLIEAIRQVAEGKFFFSESITCRLGVEHGRLGLREPTSRTIASLTKRERELLDHLSRGASLKEAAAAMHISYKTADNQKASLMRKLDIHDRVELARFAIREKLVSPY